MILLLIILWHLFGAFAVCGLIAAQDGELSLLDVFVSVISSSLWPLTFIGLMVIQANIVIWRKKK